MAVPEHFNAPASFGRRAASAPVALPDMRDVPRASLVAEIFCCEHTRQSRIAVLTASTLTTRAKEVDYPGFSRPVLAPCLKCSPPRSWHVDLHKLRDLLKEHGRVPRFVDVREVTPDHMLELLSRRP